jgi:hypothetical protein
VLRLWLLSGAGWLLDGDESLSTLMALAVLEGDRPIMLKSQPYAAAWQPYAMAASYALLGVSRMAAKLPNLLESVALVGVTWLLTREVAGPVAARFAAVLAAAPPIYVAVLSLKPFAPYTEVTLLGSVALLCSLRLAFDRCSRNVGGWAVACGAAGGLAFWMHPLAVLLPPARRSDPAGPSTWTAIGTGRHVRAGGVRDGSAAGVDLQRPDRGFHGEVSAGGGRRTAGRSFVSPGGLVSR